MTDTPDDEPGEVAGPDWDALDDKWQRLPTRLTAQVLRDELGYRAVAWRVTDRNDHAVRFRSRGCPEREVWMVANRDVVEDLAEWR